MGVAVGPDCLFDISLNIFVKKSTAKLTLRIMTNPTRK